MHSNQEKHSDTQRYKMSQKTKTKALEAKGSSKVSQEDIDHCQFDSGAIMSDQDLMFESRESFDDESTTSSSSNKWRDSGLQMDSGLGIESFLSDLDVHSEKEQVPSPTEKQNKPDDKTFIFQDQDGDSPLHLAVVHGDPRLVFQIVALYPEYINVTNHLSQTALHLAVLLNHARLVRRLVVCGAHVYQCDCQGDTPIHIACRLGHLECLQALTVPVIPKEMKEAGLDSSQPPFQLNPHLLQQRNYEGLTCTHLAAASSHKVLEYIVQCGADINAKEGKSGKTVLHQSVELECLEIVNFLLSVCKAEVNARNYARHTPLHVAHLRKRYGAKSSRTDALVKLLQENGGEPHDFLGDTEEVIPHLGDIFAQRMKKSIVAAH